MDNHRELLFVGVCQGVRDRHGLGQVSRVPISSGNHACTGSWTARAVMGGAQETGSQMFWRDNDHR